MLPWTSYPPSYRHAEVDAIRRAVCAGQCVSVVGLSGSGKSNLLGFIANRVMLPAPCPRFVLVDCNRLAGAGSSPAPSAAALFRLLLRALHSAGGAPETPALAQGDELAALEALEGLVAARLADGQGLCLLLDRFERVSEAPEFPALAGSLRALRDAFKYQLTYVTATRRPLSDETELAELFYGQTLWLGPLERDAALWSARRDGLRFTGGAGWEENTLAQLVDLTWGYPSLLRAACEAYAAGCPLESAALAAHPAIARRAAEFWADHPSETALHASRLTDHPLLQPSSPPSVEGGPGWGSSPVFDTTQLTAKEHLLLAYLQTHPDQVCEKDDLIRAVWPEDVIFTQGIRDDSLAQLVRRLRLKIEPDAGEPRYIHTVPGRGYLFRS